MKKEKVKDAKNVIAFDDAERRKKRRGIRVRRILTLLVVGALIAFVAVNWEWTSPAAVVRRIRISKENRGRSMTYPLDLTQENPVLLCGLENGGLLITNTGYYTLSNDEAARFSHGFSQPTANIFDPGAVIFSVGGSNYFVQSSSGKLYAGSTENTLLAASCAPNGACALLTKPSSATAKLTVLSASRAELFTQTFVGSTVSAISLSSNARRVAAAGATTVNGQLSATVLIYDISKLEPVEQLELGDQVVLGMSFSKTGGLTVICDRAVFFYNADYKLMLCHVYDGELSGLWCSADGYLAVMADSGSQETGEKISVFRSGTLLFEHTVPAQTQAVSVYNGKVAYCSGNVITLCDATGTVLGSCVTQETEGEALCVTADSVLQLSKGRLVRYEFSAFS